MKREGYQDAANILSLSKETKYTPIVSSLTVANLAYILRKVLSGNKLYDVLNQLVNHFTIVDLTEQNVFSALDLRAPDFEDALQYYSAMSAKVDFIITRNKKDFTFSKIEVLTPKEFLKRYKV
jgi:predicted nucleic acid-binding protein